MKNWTEICLCLSEARLNAYRQDVGDTMRETWALIGYISLDIHDLFKP